MDVLIDDGWYGGAPTFQKVAEALGLESASKAVVTVPAFAAGRVFV